MKIKGIVTVISYEKGIFYIDTDQYKNGRSIIFRVQPTEREIIDFLYRRRGEIVSLEIENLRLITDTKRRFTVLYSGDVERLLN
ncbi:MAG: hypothetical protein N3E38_02250 [Candidatus Aenigmarchaeota archaeon]|nr:hypothetical protein [Candidatus Aenigmarchaeota archaeon]